MNKMAVFYTKKAKAKMRARKRRKEKAGGGGGHPHKHEHDVVPTTLGGDYGNQRKKGSRKRSADQISNGQKHQTADGGDSTSDMHKKSKPGKQQQQRQTITVPANLTSKEAKKFRKDARRKARADGLPDDQIRFVVEGQERDKQSTIDETAAEGEGDEDKREKKKAKKSFPRINDLLSQHAAQQKLEEKISKQKSANEALSPDEKKLYVAIDCEMVGVGSDGRKSALARASVVDWDGQVLLDTYVRVPERVTDFRTRVSGIRPKDIHARNEDAMEPDECRLAVGKLLLDKILVGHALKNDLAALMLTHPKAEIRDTAKYKPFMRPLGRGGGKLRPRKLRDLVLENLGKKIQAEGEAHSSVDDARASMELYKCVRGRWEKEIGEKLKGKKIRGKK